MKLVGTHSNEMVLDSSLCPKEKNYEWSFIQCPGKKRVIVTIAVFQTIQFFNQSVFSISKPRIFFFFLVIKI